MKKKKEEINIIFEEVRNEILRMCALLLVDELLTIAKFQAYDFMIGLLAGKIKIKVISP